MNTSKLGLPTMHIRYVSFWLFILCLSACTSVTIDESSIFQPTKYDPDETRAELAINAEASLTDEDVRLSHFRIPSDIGPIAMTRAEHPENAGKPLILTCMGNASDRRTSGARFINTSIGFGDVLIFDYPGYNDSAGEASEQDFDATIRAIIAYAESEKSKTNRPIITWGHSLGGFICSEMVARSQVFDGIIIETSAKNVDQIVDDLFPLIAKPFVEVNVKESLRAYDNANALKAFAGPVLVLGAGKDKTLSVKLSRKLASALEAQGNDIEYVEFPTARHSTVRRAEGFADTANKFFAKFK